MVHDGDPKAAIQAEVGAFVGNISVLGARLLVAVYVRPEKTASGLYLTARTVSEDRFQGKVGLVLAKGPIAFVDDATHRFGKITPQIGDWVVFSVGDTFALELGERRVRSIEDVDVHMIVQSPDCIW